MAEEPYIPGIWERPVRPAESPTEAIVGWRCPVCGGGCSPFVDRCPCQPPKPVQTYTTNGFGPFQPPPGAGLFWSPGGVPSSWKMVGDDTPWPLGQVVQRLADAASHLLDDHDCDVHGHEGIRYAEQAARRYLAGGS